MIPIQTPKILGSFIRARRRELKFNQATLANRVGVSRQWIIELEQGKPGASIALVLRTIKALGLNLAIDEPAKSQGSTSPIDIDAIVKRAQKAHK